MDNRIIFSQKNEEIYAICKTNQIVYMINSFVFEKKVSLKNEEMYAICKTNQIVYWHTKQLVARIAVRIGLYDFLYSL